ncbi:COX15/CtaA family protein [Lentiprolixibacter aurantiacus]|uniref:COX15/CtaA family protein n=1 Tax=Lentiprolixibacter aurantiacus TaxID=2993939 RepID=A0AAE3MP78_9FLAO|nr:COX15/CtaA family protein [Lentiprolixibacter aurantiacus]MCX2720474.1 COX15/CtaA family protein [Lentiprolixibacter aurantiacus]
MKKMYRRLAKTSLILVYLVILAGAVVRMTGSGMGCPDWPKCFGYLIPPTEESELIWAPGSDYEKGQVIIREEQLWVAQLDFTSGESYNAGNWAVYDKHDYAVFNVFHTWTEFINRLLGALAGFATLLLAISSFGYWKEQKFITGLSVLVVFAMGFQAWLGATVVYSVLEPVKITVHMVMALAIVALLLFLIHKTGKHRHERRIGKNLRGLVLVAMVFTMVQIVLGTQVRQLVDEQIELLGETAKDLWLAAPTMPFYIHRSFSILVLLLNAYLAYRIFRDKLGFSKINWVLALLLAEAITGIIMYYLNFPFSSQPLHLFLATVLFGVQFFLVLEVFMARGKLKTS